MESSMRLYCGLRVCRGAYPALQLYPYGGRGTLSLSILLVYAKQSPFTRYKYMNLKIIPPLAVSRSPRTTRTGSYIYTPQRARSTARVELEAWLEAVPHEGHRTGRR